MTGSEYYWVHLLRPANPNATNMQTEPKVVVDSFRFPYFVNVGTVTSTDPDNQTVNRDNHAI